MKHYGLKGLSVGRTALYSSKLKEYVGKFETERYNSTEMPRIYLFKLLEK